MYNFNICNIDTDSIMVTKPDGAPFSEQEQEKLIKELNSLFPEHINWDEDGYFESVVVIKAKNYVMKEHETGSIKIKGSGLKDAKKELALKEMLNKMIDSMLNDRQHELVDIYHSYVKEACNVKDIKRWCTKKTLTESIFDCKGYTQNDIKNKKIRKNETDIWDAVKNEEGIQQGDKVYLYPTILGMATIPGIISEKTGKQGKDRQIEVNGFKMDKYWTNDHDVEKLLDRIYKTIKIFETVLNMDNFIDYSLKRNKDKLAKLIS